MFEAFTMVVPVPAGVDPAEFEAEAGDLFALELVERGLVMASEPVVTLLPQRSLVPHPTRSVETNGGPDLLVPVTAVGPAWKFTVYVDLV